jgi:hypothetical protein
MYRRRGAVTMRAELTVYSNVVCSLVFAGYFILQIFDAYNPALAKVMFWSAVLFSIWLFDYNRKHGIVTWYHEYANNALIKSIKYIGGISLLYTSLTFIISAKTLGHFGWWFGLIYVIVNAGDWAIHFLVGNRSRTFSTKIA